VKRILIGAALLIGGLLGLFMTACGGYITLSSFGSGGIQGFLAISVPSLLGGVLLLRFVKRRVDALRSEGASSL
jgi:hypothetical protein